ENLGFWKKCKRCDKSAFYIKLNFFKESTNLDPNCIILANSKCIKCQSLIYKQGQGEKNQICYFCGGQAYNTDKSEDIILHEFIICSNPYCNESKDCNESKKL